MFDYDVAVVGGGPSGLNISRRLADSGLRVVLFDRKKAIGEGVVCAGIVGMEAFPRFSLNKNAVLSELQKVRLVSPFKTAITYEHPEPFAYVLDRKKFDRDLAALAVGNGTVLSLGSHVTDITVNRRRVCLNVENEGCGQRKFYTKLAVLASGIDIGLNKKLGLGYPKSFMIGIQAELEMKQPMEPAIMVGRDIAPGAFAWVVPIGGGRVRAGLVTDKEPRSHFERFLSEFFPEYTNRLDKGQIQVKAIAQGLQSRTYGTRVLVVGEAAGQVKTTTGGGIFYGLMCSEIAAEVIQEKIQDDDLGEKDLVIYERKWKRLLQKELLIGHYARKACARLSDPEIEKIFQFAKNDGVLPLIRRKGDFDWHSSLILALIKRVPLFSFHRRITTNVL